MLYRNGRMIGAFSSGIDEGYNALYRYRTPTVTREEAYTAGARTFEGSSFREAAAAQGITLPPPSPIVQLVKGPSSPGDEGGIPQAVLIGGGVVGVLALAAIAYKFLG